MLIFGKFQAVRVFERSELPLSAILYIGNEQNTVKSLQNERKKSAIIEESNVKEFKLEENN